MTLRIRLRAGDEARAAMADGAFVAAWQELADRDPKPTIFQEPTYCLAYYAAYAGRIDPLLVCGSVDDQLVGLLPLAREADRLFHAGDHQCEYQGWLADPATGDAFPARAVDAVLRGLGVRSWDWRHVVPGASLDWIDDLGTRRSRVAVRTVVSCPVLDVHDDEFIAARTRGRLRGYRNRLERRGMRYERVTDPGRAGVVLERLALWCDIRQGAAHTVMPFASDPAKLDFHRRLLATPERFWLSALWLGDDLLAAHLGPFDGRELALGVQGYDPREARLSPGAVLMFELARDVRAAGGTILDLTPGGDAWKERYASGHRDVQRLHFGRRVGVIAGAAARRLQTGARAALRKLGAEPGRVRSAVLDAVGSRVATPSAKGLYELARTPTEVTEATRPAPDRLDRLVRDHAARLDDDAAADFLAAVARLLAEGWQPIVIDDDDRLDGLGWKAPEEGWIDLTDLAAPRCRRDLPAGADFSTPEGIALTCFQSPAGFLPASAPERLLHRACSPLPEATSSWLLLDETDAGRCAPGLLRPLHRATKAG